MSDPVDVTPAGSQTVLPYGSWPTPITSALVTGSSRLPTEAVRSNGVLWWAEARPDEGGRTALRARRDGDAEPVEALRPDANARTAAHEYGGGAWWARGETVWYCDWATQRIQRLELGGDPVAVTPPPAIERGLRFADGDISPDGSTIVCVCEDHTADGEATNTVVTLDANAESAPYTFASGADFVLGPRWSPDAATISWIEWDHPNMPWDETRLVVAAVDRDGNAGERTVVAGGDQRESICQADWSNDGTLWFSSDRNGFWALYRWSPTSGTTETMADLAADIGFPAWNFGERCFALLDDGSCVFWYSADGVHRLGRRRADGIVDRLDVPFTFYTAIVPEGDGVVVTAASPTTRLQVVRVVPTGEGSHAAVEVLVAGADPGLDPSWISAPQPITFPTPAADGPAEAHGLYYPPNNPDAVGPPGERPPLIVIIHGGPTSQARAMLSLALQFWTSRGFAVVDVNYRGSTGYGRQFRDLLRGEWGVADVEDCVAAARYLADRGDADPERLLIRGGSAGGFTTLAALAFHDTFAAGASHFGVADLEALATETHKFESRYLDLIVGPWPEAKSRYDERSPIHHVDGFDKPLAVFQGADDKVVLPNQAEMIVSALRDRGVPVSYTLFEGEGHGFRRAENQRAALDGELSFYSQVLRFELPAAEGITPVDVENL